MLSELLGVGQRLSPYVVLLSSVRDQSTGREINSLTPYMDGLNLLGLLVAF